MSLRSTGARLLAGTAAGWAGLAALTYHRAFGARRWGSDRDRGWTPEDVAVPHVVLPVTTADGVELLAWHLVGSLPAVIVVSGGHRGRAGDVLGIGGALQRAGFHVVTYGWRGTPGSGRGAHTLGDHERRDLTAVLDATAATLGDLPVGLLGYSLGGAVSIMVAADDRRVRAVCADSAFAAATDVLEEGVRRTLHLPGGLVRGPVTAALRLRTGARLGDVRPVDVVGRIAPRPLLIVHGARDRAVDVRSAHRLLEAAAPPVELWVIPDVIHVGGYFADRAAYVDRVTSFFREGLLGS